MRGTYESSFGYFTLKIMKEITINKSDACGRLDKYLKKLMPAASSGFIYKMLRKKNIVLNGKKAEGSELLGEGDVIKIFFSDETYAAMTAGREKAVNESVKRLPVVYEDDDILILDKPSGMLSQSDGSGEASVNDCLRSFYGDSGVYKPSVCNRLDRNTSGLIMCAKTYAGSRFFDECIKKHCVRKFYSAVCEGRIDKPGTLEGYLYKDEVTNKVSIKRSGDDAHFIKTVYRPVKDLQGYTELEVEIISGKSHQIRAHLSSIGHPIAGDKKYGGHPYKGKHTQLLRAVRLEFPESVPETFNESQKEILGRLLNKYPDGKVSIKG